MIIFDVPIDPIAQPRPKARRIGNGIQIYTPENQSIRAYKAAIAQAFREGAPEGYLPSEKPIGLSITFFIARPASNLRKNRIGHDVKPDIDNLIKGVMDALNGVAWHDDSQVVELHVKKKWSPINPYGGRSRRKAVPYPGFITVMIEENPFREEFNE